MPTFELPYTPYAPEPEDDNPASYLTRCGEAMLAYGHQYQVLGGPADPNDPESQPVRQLQVTIPDEDVAGGKRTPKFTAPETIIDVGGEPMTETAFNTKYGTP